MYMPGETTTELRPSSPRYLIPALSSSVGSTAPCVVHKDMPVPIRVYLNIFAIRLTTRFVVVPAYACADPGGLGSGEKNGGGNFRYGHPPRARERDELSQCHLDVGLPMRVRRSLEEVPTHPAALVHALGADGMLDDRLGLVRARKGSGVGVHALVLEIGEMRFERGL